MGGRLAGDRGRGVKLHEEARHKAGPYGTWISTFS